MSPRRAALLLLLILLCGGCSLFHRRRGPRPLYKKLSPPVAYEMMRDSPQMLVIDLRPPQQFDGPTGHVREAKNVPVSRLPYRLLEVLPFREDTVFIYCDTDECTEQGAKILRESGFESIVGMAGGINQWIRDGFKTVLPARIAERRGEVEKPAVVMPEKPGEKKNDPNREVPVKPPVPPPAPPDASPPPPPPGVAAPRQIR
ncbi:MAG TPA: rhodanese-like domain-containing protein [Thermoanaerobaculia bacterium]|nr:rhodanese-like domain-containing protein [Thermoanaerobaculia bacterium]